MHCPTCKAEYPFTLTAEQKLTDNINCPICDSAIVLTLRDKLAIVRTMQLYKVVLMRHTLWDTETFTMQIVVYNPDNQTRNTLLYVDGSITEYAYTMMLYKMRYSNLEMERKTFFGTTIYSEWINTYGFNVTLRDVVNQPLHKGK